MFQSQTMDRSNPTTNGMQQYSALLLAEKTQGHLELRRRLDNLDSGRVSVEDQAPVLHEQFVSIRHNNSTYEKVKAIDAALDRLNNGEYGICKECGDPIAKKRLHAVPWTQYCLQCQENLSGDAGSPAFRQLRAA